MSRPVMCHVVAGYPDAETCLQLMLGMDKKGAAAIEVQIPFSDPIADGEVIMHANDTALAGGMTIAGSFELVQQARNQGVACNIFIMSYLQKVQHFGLEAFCQAAEKNGANGLIIPDLPYDSPEYAQLLALAHACKLELIPVFSPGMPKKRLVSLLGAKPARVYVTSQRGITGNAYTGTQELERLISDIKGRSSAIVMIGFGIANSGDVNDALKLGDMAVVGSAVIKRLETSGIEKTLDYVGTLIKEDV